MSRKPPNRRRRRGHRAPSHGPSRNCRTSPRKPQGFTPPGWRQFANVVLPHRGAEKRLFFNEVGDGIAVAIGLVGLVVGYAALGVLGAILGLWASVTLCGMALEDGRYIRR